MPRRTRQSSDTGFSLRHFPEADSATDGRIFRPLSFSQSASDKKNIAGVCHDTLVSAGFLYSNMTIRALAVGGWSVTFGTAMRGLVG